jgi:hypothetical protein
VYDPLHDERVGAADPAGIELQFLAHLAIEHRNRRRRLANLQLEDRKPVERGIGDLDPVPDEQLGGPPRR